MLQCAIIFFPLCQWPCLWILGRQTNGHVQENLSKKKREKHAYPSTGGWAWTQAVAPPAGCAADSGVWLLESLLLNFVRPIGFKSHGSSTCTPNVFLFICIFPRGSSSTLHIKWPQVVKTENAANQGYFAPHRRPSPSPSSYVTLQWSVNVWIQHNLKHT